MLFLIFAMQYMASFTEPVAVQEGSHGTMCPSAGDVEAVARVIYSECRGEPAEGRKMVVDAILNISSYEGVTIRRACRMKGISSGLLEERFVLEAEEMMVSPRTHNFTHWLNPKKTTDKKWLGHAMAQPGDSCYNHYFF